MHRAGLTPSTEAPMPKADTDHTDGVDRQYDDALLLLREIIPGADDDALRRVLDDLARTLIASRDRIRSGG